MICALSSDEEQADRGILISHEITVLVHRDIAYILVASADKKNFNGYSNEFQIILRISEGGQWPLMKACALAGGKIVQQDCCYLGSGTCSGEAIMAQLRIGTQYPCRFPWASI